VIGVSRAVYGSKYLAIYVKGTELDKLLDGRAVELDLFAEAFPLGDKQVIVGLMPDGLAALRTVVRAERKAYGKGRTRWKRFPPNPLK
jgi:hypothetical protein